MKLSHTEYSPAGEKCLVFRTNAHELIILRELVKNAKIYTPKTEDNQKTVQRIKGIYKEFNKVNLEDLAEKEDIKNKQNGTYHK